MKRNVNVLQRDVTRIPVTYYIEQLPYIRERLPIGMVFYVDKRQEEDGSRTRKRYTVVEKYPYHASCMDQCGQRRSFGYFELDQLLGGVA